MSCQLDTLRRCLPQRIRKALNELPDTLDETYERTLQEISKEKWEYAYRLFQCITVARRPLGVAELADFLAFDLEAEGSPIFRADWRSEDAKDTVLSTCSTLVSIVDAGGSPVVQFSHFSVKEYLTSSRMLEGRVPRYHIPLEPAHVVVTEGSMSFYSAPAGQRHNEGAHQGISSHKVCRSLLGLPCEVRGYVVPHRRHDETALQTWKPSFFGLDLDI